MAHPVRPDEYQEINNFYTATVYEKGAEVIRMQHTLLGAERVSPRHRSLLRAPRRPGGHLRRLRAGDAGCVGRRSRAVPPLVLAGGHAGGQRRRQLRRAGADVHARRRAAYAADAGTAGEGCRSTFRSRSGCSAATAATCRSRSPARPRRGRRRVCWTFATRAQRFQFVGVAAAPVPSLLRGFSAPVQVTFDYRDDDIVFLAAHDSDPVNRWDAAQRAFADAMLRLARDHREGRALALPAPLAALVGHLLADERQRPGGARAGARAARSRLRRRARARRSTPTASSPRTRSCCASSRGASAAHSRWRTTRDAPARALRDHARAGRRPQPRQRLPALPRCARRPRRARARRRTLRARRQHDRRDRRAVRAARIRRRPSATACSRISRRSGATSRWCSTSGSRWRRAACAPTRWRGCRALLAHPRFNARNPNRVRALVGAFALGNFARFHAADGAGYAFAADQVLALDATNPQLASMIAGAFSLWKRFAAPRRARRWKRRSSASPRRPSLSPDVREIVTRSLGD